MFLVYKATSPSNKVYVGLTKRSFSKRINEHYKEARNGSTMPLYNALRKYKKTFKWEILEENLTKSQAEAFEISYIAFFDSRKLGYNVASGGQGTLEIVYSKERLKKTKNHLEKIRMDSKCVAKRAKNMGGKPFICVETGERFEYLMQAALKFQTNDKQNIYRVLKGIRNSYKKFHFKYVE